MLPVVETNIESHIDALNSRAKSMRILDTTTVTSEQPKAGSINGKKPYLSSVNELIATSAFSSSPLFKRKCGHFSLFYLYGFSLSAVFQWGDYALSDFLKDDYLHQVIAF